MIFCKQKDLNRYLGLSHHLDTAIRFLSEADLQTLAMGKNVIDGEAVYVNRFDYDTVIDPITEGHLRYIDIHVVLEGEEIVAVSDPSVLTEIERKEDEDYIGFQGKFQSMNILRPGDVLICFPEDAHSPKRICGAESCHVKKAVVKVLIEGGR